MPDGDRDGPFGGDHVAAREQARTQPVIRSGPTFTTPSSTSRPGTPASSERSVSCPSAIVVRQKWAGHRIGQVNFVRPGRSMSQIGG